MLDDYQNSLINEINASKEKNFFITGPAGSGKSFILKNLAQSREAGTFQILSPTGTATVLIQCENCTAQTFHAFFAKLDFRQPLIDICTQAKIIANDLKRRLRSEDFSLLLIDEISMVSSRMLTLTDWIFRYVRNELNRSFGGLQVVIFGDFRQLPPIFSPEPFFVSELSDEMIRESMAFDCRSWQDANYETILLKTNYRQEGDDQFLKILSNVRVNKMTLDDCRQLFRRQPIVDITNTCHNIVFISVRNKIADDINAERYKHLSGEEKIYKYHVLPDTACNDRLGQDLLKQKGLLLCMPLKIGTQVMFRQNNYSAGYTNGTCGKITKMHDEHVTIVTDSNSEVQVFKMGFPLNKEQTAFVYQFPIAYAWGMTIHRVQGQSIDYMSIDLAHLFACYQAYVGLSRAKTLKRLFITNYQHNMALVDPMVERFYKKYENIDDNLDDDDDYVSNPNNKKRKRKNDIMDDFELIQVLDYDAIFEKCNVKRALKHKVIRNDFNFTSVHLQPHEYDLNLHSLYWTNKTRDLLFFLTCKDFSCLNLKSIVQLKTTTTTNEDDDDGKEWIINFLDQIHKNQETVPLVHTLVLKCNGPIIINKKTGLHGNLKIDMAHYNYLVLTGACLFTFHEIILNSKYCKDCEFFIF